MTTADVYGVVLDALRAAALATAKTDALLDVRRLVEDLDDLGARRVVVGLAVEAAWRRGADRAELVRWVDRMRIEVAWQAPETGEVER